MVKYEKQLAMKWETFPPDFQNRADYHQLGRISIS